MITDLKKALGNTLLLFVNNRPAQSSEPYFDRDEDGNEIGEKKTWTKEAITGVLMSATLNPKQATTIEVGIRTSQMESILPGGPNFGDILEAFFENKAGLISGKKLMKVETLALPRVNKTGKNVGVANSFNPALIGFSIVDATPSDIDYIEALKSLNNENTEVVATTEVAIA